MSFAQAKAALPDPDVMPNHRPGTEVVSLGPKHVPLVPCVASPPHAIALHGAHDVTTFFAPADPAGPVFAVTLVVFHTTAKATVALRDVIVAEQRCPAVAAIAQGTVTRTLSQRYSPNGWSGWRSITRLDITADASHGTPARTLRVHQEFLVRGNVLLFLDETASTGSAATQNNARKAATKVLLHGFAALFRT